MKEWVFVLGFVALAVFLTAVSWDYPFISALYPRLLLACGFFLSGVKIFRLLRDRKKQIVRAAPAGAEEHPPHPQRMWIYLGSGVLYMLLMPPLGFILSSFVTLFVLFRFYGLQPKTTLSVSLGTPLSLHFLFVVALRIPLPRGVVERLLF